MRIVSLLAALLLAFAGSINAQRHCAAEEVLHQQLLDNPALRARLDEIERHTQDFQAAGGAQERVVVTIPVVVNVVWNTAAENISAAEIASQIAVLNADFRRLNADAANTPAIFQGISADLEVNFCMAVRDPSGNATDGIRRRQTTVTAFSTNDAVKYNAQGGLDAWPRDQYLNLWVCDLSGGLLGYAQFPGGAAATDGVVCDYQYFGTIGSLSPFNKGRTATHEVGHWLNLYHIWGDDGTSCTGTDLVADTPNQADENYGCPTYPQVSCSNSALGGDMFMNYMDYTDDACMNAFTAGQKTRAQSLFAGGGSRVSLLSSLGCQTPTGGSCAAPSGLNATSITQTTATVNWGAVSGAVTYNLQYKVSTSATWTTITGLTATTRNLTGLTAATTYNYQVQTVCSSSSSSYSAASSFTTASPAGSCVDVYEPNNAISTAKVIPVNTTFTAQIATATDKDYYKFSNTSTQRRIKVDLTTLPFDYDLRLYRNGTQVGISENGGTTNEQIILNTTTVSSAYVAYVYGYNGAFSTSQCYTLRVSLSATNWRTDGTTDGESTEIEIPVLFENAGFGMYPNPATDQLTIEVDMESENDVQVAVTDASGRIAVQQHRTMGKGDNKIQVDLGALSNGIYFVQVRNGDTVNTRKLVVQK